MGSIALKRGVRVFIYDKVSVSDSFRPQKPQVILTSDKVYIAGQPTRTNVYRLSFSVTVPEYDYVSPVNRTKLIADRVPITDIFFRIKDYSTLTFTVNATPSLNFYINESSIFQVSFVANVSDKTTVYKAPSVYVQDATKTSDSVSLYHSIDPPLFLVMFPYKPRYRYVTVSITDSTNIKDVPNVYKLPIIQIVDSVKVSDSISTYHILNTSIYSVLFAYRPRYRYVTLSAVDSANVKDSVTVKPPVKVSVADKVSVSGMLVTGNTFPGGWYASVLPEVVIADSPVIRDVFKPKNIAIYVKDRARIADAVTVIKANKTVFITDSVRIKDIASATKQ